MGMPGNPPPINVAISIKRKDVYSIQSNTTTENLPVMIFNEDNIELTGNFTTDSISFNNPGTISNITQTTTNTTITTLGDIYRYPPTGFSNYISIQSSTAATSNSIILPGFSVDTSTHKYTYNANSKLPLTSNSMLGYIASSSSLSPYSGQFGNPSMAAYNAFDMNDNTFFRSAEAYSGSSFENPSVYTGEYSTTTNNGTTYPGEWLQIQLPEAISLHSYSLRTGGGMGGNVDYVILGSNDGSTWNLLDTRSVSSASYYTFDNMTSNSYTTYRLVYLYLSGGGDMNVNQWDLNYDDISLIEDTATQIRYEGTVPFESYGTQGTVSNPIQPSDTRPYAFDTGFIDKTFTVGDEIYFVVDYNGNPYPEMMPGMPGFPPSINVAISIKRMDASSTQIETTNTTVPIMTFNVDNVGIGTTSPYHKLHVEGNIYSSGEITAYSDLRFKENIHTLDNCLDKISNCRGVSYTRKNSESTHIGFIAQELENIFPDVVHTNPYNGVKSVAYGNITAILVECIKELQNEIKELKSYYQNNK